MTGSNCAVTVTASFWIFAINTAACPGIPTLSASPPQTRTASVRCSVTGTSHFTSAIERSWSSHRLYWFGLFVVPMILPG
jgi:hypothetical protein